MNTNPKEMAANDLKRLLTVCADGVAGYRHAAKAVEDPELHAALMHCAAEREEVASVLTYALSKLGAKSDHHRSVAGVIHDGLLDALGVAHARDRAVLKECERGERATFHALEEVLSHPLPPEVRSVVQSQYGRLLAASERLTGLEIMAAERNSLPGHPGRGVKTAGAVAGATTGAIVGAIAGIPGAIGGAVVGAVAGEVAGAAVGRRDHDVEVHEADLDEEIGVTKGELGASREILDAYEPPRSRP
jgi:uncharacterized protein (TIGR02284 family)